MNYYSENDIRDMVSSVLRREMTTSVQLKDRIPLEVSARHVHLTQEAVEVLFGRGYTLTQKRDLSQPGEFLSGERVKLVTAKGEIANVAVLGPVRKQIQVELSATDCRGLGVQAPLRLSGDVSGAGDVLIIGPAGMVDAKGSVIVAKAHIHMLPEDAQKYGVTDGQTVCVRIQSGRPITLEGVVVRVKPSFKLALHIDFDEANAAQADGQTPSYLQKG